ncbi:RHS repeat domain-containing protein [Paraglaciecola sp. MB-3u-78]|uniref:RHS repeat domain-containing protein n=1 Tax=Paraglaciecola sp. MB-3u-78 TaxID=2058332 RepID=UPI000C3333AB|nr:RHS repeat-associated core domain-containing protein [Paraglaciecola sp. MB-3u-78]PKG95671.1 hypothetical protein CXF95_25600 [Paraglaciecola sp. MB-3u-78]
MTNGANQITKSNYKVTQCITNPNGEEGFKVAGPDGLTYEFNYVKSYSNGKIIPGSTLEAKTKLIYVTKIHDRFGNNVVYNYDSKGLKSIVSSDGRTINITYSSSSGTKYRVSKVTANNREWHYYYNSNSLSEVDLPEGKKWTYSGFNWMKFNPDSQAQNFGYHFFYEKIDPNTQIPTFSKPGCSFNANSADLTYNVTAPTDIAVAYKARKTYFYDSQVKPGAFRDRNTNDGLVGNVPCSASYALVEKSVAGPGIEDRAYTYAYSQNIGGFFNGHLLQTRYPTENAPSQPSTGFPSIVATSPKDFRTTTIDDGTKKSIFYTYRKFGSHNQGVVLVQDIIGQAPTELLDRKEFEYQKGDYVGNDWSRTRHHEYPNDDPINSNQTEYRMFLKSKKDARKSDVYTINYFTSTCDVNCNYDSYGFPQITVETNNFSNKKRYTKQYYYNDTTNWLIGQPSYRQVSSNGSAYTETSRTSYYSATGSYKSLPKYQYTFGRWFKYFQYYHTSGASAGLPRIIRYNGTSRWAEYSNYKRGIAQTIRTPKSLSVNSQYAYKVVDNNGRVTKQTDFMGNCINYDYDELGRMTLIDPCDPYWHNTNVSYTTTSGAEGYTYVEAGMLKQTISKGNYRKVTYHDSLLRARMTKEWDTANEGTTKRYTRMKFDAFNRPVYQSKPHSLNNTPYGNTITYDGLGRPKVVDDNTTSGNISYSYLANNRVQVNNNRGQVTTTTFLAYGTPEQNMATTVASPQNVTSTLAYNIYGNLTSVSQGGQTEYRVYDSYQQLCKVNRNDVGRTAYQYDALGKLSWQATGSSVSTSNTACDINVDAQDKVTSAYDNLGNLKRIDFGDGTASKEFGYDKNNNLTQLIFGGVTQNYTYNDLNMPETERLRVDSLDWMISHTYDALGNEANLIYPTGGNLSYIPNAFGQPKHIGVFASNISFHPNGQYNSYQQRNGCVNTMSLRTSGLPDTQRSVCGSANAVYNQYTFDANGNVKFWDDKQSNTYDLRFTYDGLDRIDNVRKANQTLIGDMNYDTMGNITKFDSIVGTIHYDYDPAKRLQSTSGMRSYDFSYDGRGNVTDSGYHTFSYNLANQMEEADDNSYLYDGRNKRVKTVDGAGTRYSMYSLAGKLVYERINGANRANYYMGSQLVAHQGAGPQTFIHPDLMGTTAAKSNSSGAVTKRLRYAPFGLEWGKTNAESGDNEIGYTGHKHDNDIGLTYMQARYYDPVIGRFYSNDPVGYTAKNPVMSFNRYLYVNNNPYKYTDPNGEFLFLLPLIGFLSGGYTAYQAAGDMGASGNTQIVAGLGGALTGLFTGGTTALATKALALTVVKTTVSSSLATAGKLAAGTVTGAISSGSGQAIGDSLTDVSKGEKVDIDMNKVALKTGAGAVDGFLAASPGSILTLSPAKKLVADAFGVSVVGAKKELEDKL